MVNRLFGVFGAAPASAYAIGTLSGAAGVDLARTVLQSPVRGYVSVFAVEARSSRWPRSGAPQRVERAGRSVIRQRGELLSAVLQ